MVEYNKIIILKEYLKDIWNDWKVEDVITYKANIIDVDYTADRDDMFIAHLDTMIDGHDKYHVCDKDIIKEDTKSVIAQFEYITGGIRIRKTMILYKK